MRNYAGIRNEDDACSVTVNGDPLAPRRDLFNHSPTGFEWGYGGSGPAQLALALMCDLLVNEPEALKVAKRLLGHAEPIAPMAGEEEFVITSDEIAVRLHQRLKDAVVVGLPRADWRITSAELLAVVTGWLR